MFLLWLDDTSIGISKGNEEQNEKNTSSRPQRSKHDLQNKHPNFFFLPKISSNLFQFSKNENEKSKSSIYYLFFCIQTDLPLSIYPWYYAMMGYKSVTCLKPLVGRHKVGQVRCCCQPKEGNGFRIAGTIDNKTKTRPPSTLLSHT